MMSKYLLSKELTWPDLRQSKHRRGTITGNFCVQLHFYDYSFVGWYLINYFRLYFYSSKSFNYTFIRPKATTVVLFDDTW
jgi:hypothetical protein